MRTRMTRTRLTAVSLGVLTAVLALAAAAGASLIGLYRNSMETDAQRGQMVKLSGERCAQPESTHVFKIVIGKRTKECTYRTPVVGRDLEIVAVESLLSSTPKALQHKAFLALNLRADAEGAGYELAVYPTQGKAQLRKILSDGTIKYLHIEKNVGAIKGIDEPNELRLNAFNVTSGPEQGSVHIVASVGGEVVASVTDETPDELTGEAAGFSVGAATGAKGTAASVDNVVVRVPSPF
jgi:hypothetical protein